MELRIVIQEDKERVLQFKQYLHQDYYVWLDVTIVDHEEAEHDGCDSEDDIDNGEIPF